MNKKGTISPELKVEVVEKYLYQEYAITGTITGKSLVHVPIGINM